MIRFRDSFIASKTVTAGAESDSVRARTKKGTLSGALQIYAEKFGYCETFSSPGEPMRLAVVLMPVSSASFVDCFRRELLIC